MPKGVYNHRKGYTCKPRSIESRLKQSLSRTGKKYGPHSEETKKKIGLSNSIAQKGKKRPWRAGANTWSWKGGVTNKNEAIRKSMEYKIWRKSVFERDDFTCQICKVRGVELQADHIKPFAYYPELRFDINNGRTLCKPCHMTTPTYSNRYKHEYNKMVV